MMFVKLDQKMRVRLPKRISQRLRLKGKEIMELSVKGNTVQLSVSKGKKVMDPVLRDMIERPLHSKIPITHELLEKLEEEQWSGL